MVWALNMSLKCLLLTINLAGLLDLQELVS